MTLDNKEDFVNLVCKVCKITNISLEQRTDLEEIYYKLASQIEELSEELNDIENSFEDLQDMLERCSTLSGEIETMF